MHEFKISESELAEIKTNFYEFVKGTLRFTDTTHYGVNYEPSGSQHKIVFRCLEQYLIIRIEKPMSNRYQEDDETEEEVTSLFFYRMSQCSVFNCTYKIYEFHEEDMFEGEISRDDLLKMLKNIARDTLLDELWPSRCGYFDKLTEKLLWAESLIPQKLGGDLDADESVKLISKSTQDLLKTNFLRDLEDLGYPVKLSPEFFSLEFLEDNPNSSYERLSINFTYGFCYVRLEIQKYIGAGAKDVNSVYLYSPANLSDFLFNRLQLREDEITLLEDEPWDDVLEFLSELSLEDYILSSARYLDFIP